MWIKQKKELKKTKEKEKETKECGQRQSRDFLMLRTFCGLLYNRQSTFCFLKTPAVS
jgi:hypothetical protein